MNILYYFKELPTPMYQWQRFHIFDELERHDCHITVFNPLEYPTIERANETLISYIKKNRFDLFMTPHNEKDLFIPTLQAIKGFGIATLLICFDNLVIPFVHRQICRHFDLVWLTSSENRDLFKKWGANTLCNPYAANPEFFYPGSNITEIPKIAFIGTPYGTRVNMLNHLTRNKVDVCLYGNVNRGTDKSNYYNKQIKSTLMYLTAARDLLRFANGRKIIYGALQQKLKVRETLVSDTKYLTIYPSINHYELRRMYSNYAISLSSTAARNTGVLKNPVKIVNLRSFEIPMCGGLQICSYSEELADYFEADKEIIFYKTHEELVNKAKFYLRPENSPVRMKIKKAARKRAENEHTWFCRFKKAFDYLGLGNPYH